MTRDHQGLRAVDEPTLHVIQDATGDASDQASRRDLTRRSLDERLARPAPTVWLSGQEAAEYIGVSWPTMRKAILEQRIPHVRLGTRWMIDVAELDEHLHRLAESQAANW